MVPGCGGRGGGEQRAPLLLLWARPRGDLTLVTEVGLGRVWWCNEEFETNKPLAGVISWTERTGSLLSQLFKHYKGWGMHMVCYLDWVDIMIFCHFTHLVLPGRGWNYQNPSQSNLAIRLDAIACTVQSYGNIEARRVCSCAASQISNASSLMRSIPGKRRAPCRYRRRQLVLVLGRRPDRRPLQLLGGLPQMLLFWLENLDC